MSHDIDPKVANWTDAYHLWKEAQARAKAAGKKSTSPGMRTEVARLQHEAGLALQHLQDRSTSKAEQGREASQQRACAKQ